MILTVTLSPLGSLLKHLPVLRELDPREEVSRSAAAEFLQVLFIGKQNDNHKRILIKEGNSSKKSLKFERLNNTHRSLQSGHVISIAYPLCCLKPFSAQVMYTMYHIKIIGPL